ncbi:hypothetical protein Vadar_003489 [Vaccinium darrowii]|uniref:Uncharacterized protein n=1 Tax=Vaccinium darrowii TaxID=229202 RepID=A0ACB7Z1C7_9ERIC|nr:hypothetical protein Vadar_003489 [Vaccinium darrowii]
MDSSDIRPHRTTTTTTATTTTTPSLFICFTSRLSSASSSSSMKISSKSSILSPGRARDTPTSLSTSVSRRLKANGSLKGAQSPMFPTGGKRRGFENPEPSSPKVTCIGQVRVKTKKQGNKIRTLSRRRSGDFRRGTVRDSNNFGLNSGVNQQQQENMPIHQRNQRWVHLPLTICEALRKGFGAEFSCLFPCRAPSCLRGGEKEERERGRRKESGGEAVFGRWLVAVNEGGGEVGIGREVELVVGGEEVEERREIRERISLRRHADDEEEEDEEEEVGFEEDEKCKEGGGRLSICVPPKNALLLMRSRSDPVRVSALASRFWESPSADKCAEEAEEDDEIAEKCDERVINGVLGLVEAKADEGYEELGLVEVSNEKEEEEKPEAEVGLMEVEEREENPEERKLEIDEELCQEADEEENQELFVEEENGLNKSFPEAVTDPEKLELTEDVLLIQQGDEEDAQGRESHSSSIVSVRLFSDDEFEQEEEELAEEAALEKGEEESEEVIETQNSPWKVEGEGEEKAIDQERFESEKTQEEEAIMESEEEREEKQRESDISPLLPDCLLLMRCEPKLSMEVSKETWVCTTDFIRWLPERPPKPTDGGDGGGEPTKKKRVSTESNTVHYQPPRSSCSLPAAVAGRVSTAARIEQRLVNAVAYEPLGLTRCKSEPMRTAAAKLKPESCFWKNRKLEPHSRATVGVGAVGF